MASVVQLMDQKLQAAKVIFKEELLPLDEDARARVLNMTVADLIQHILVAAPLWQLITDKKWDALRAFAATNPDGALYAHIYDTMPAERKTRLQNHVLFFVKAVMELTQAKVE